MTTQDIANRTGSLTQSNELDYLLIDGSGSMQEKWWDFLAAADTFISASKKANLDSHLIVHVFDGRDIEMIQRDCAMRDAVSFRDEPIGSHWDSTPLYDAINLMGRRLKDRDPKKASILIVTDGGDTGSQTSIHQAKAILDWCRAKGWQVTFVGCDFNNDRQAKLLGATEANAIGVQKKLLTDAAKSLARKRQAYSTSGDDISFSETERQQFGGHLTDQSGRS